MLKGYSLRWTVTMMMMIMVTMTMTYILVHGLKFGITDSFKYFKNLVNKFLKNNLTKTANSLLYLNHSPWPVNSHMSLEQGHEHEQNVPTVSTNHEYTVQNNVNECENGHCWSIIWFNPLIVLDMQICISKYRDFETAGSRNDPNLN